MFEDSLFASSSVASPRRGWTAIVSFTIQTMFVGTLIVLPLLFTQVLPLPHWDQLISVPSAPAPAPPQPVVHETPQRWNSNMAEGHMLVPPRIPDRIAHVVETGPPPQLGIADAGVYGSTNSGIVGDGVIGSILNGMHTSSVHPTLQPLKRVPLSTGVSEGLLIHKVTPTYPSLALAAHVQGEVILQAVIGKDGTIQNLRAISGPPMLVKSALDAVQQWRYRPYLLNNEPVEVETQIHVRFTIS